METNDYQRVTQPPHPTTAPPGSEEKIKVMEERLSLGYHLYHPRDNKVTIPCRPKRMKAIIVIEKGRLIRLSTEEDGDE